MARMRLTRHPCRVTPVSVPGLSRHLRRTLRRQCHRGRKALRWQRPRVRHDGVSHLGFVTRNVTNCVPTQSIGTIVVNMSTTRMLHIGTTVG
ncbi:hypothetical protein PsP108CL_15030 [Pseudomonas syringae]|nr:hypothetical protein [Pseudomonas syringae]